MNILWILEDNQRSANYKIAYNLANIMKNKHNIICAFYGSNLCDANFELNDSFVDVLYLGCFRSKDLNTAYINSKWREKNRKEKVTYIIRHPELIIGLIKKFIAKRNKRCVTQLEAICEEYKIDAVIGTVLPYEIATIMARAKIPCKKIIIQLDPFVFNSMYNEKTRRKHIRLEQEVINSVDVILTTKFIKSEIIEIHQNRKSKVVTIEFPEMSYDVDKKEYGSNIKINKQSDSILFLHAGSFYEDIRNPKYLLELFMCLPKNYILVVAGLNTHMLRDISGKLADRIIDLGFREQKDVEFLKDKVDFLICFNNKVENQVPSKLFECIETGKPFINLCQLENCPSLPYVQDYDNSINVYVNKMEPGKVIDFVNNNKGKVIDKQTILSKYYKHTFEYVANQIEEEL